MLEGTGIKIKVVEALSYGLPVVGTEKAVDGFAFKQKNGCLTSNNEQEFADKIIKILNNEPLYNETKQEGINYFNECFSEEVNFKKWENALTIK